MTGLKNGFYLDLASNHWKSLSSTYTLEKYFNWSGICIEPNTEYLQGILENRTCQLVTNIVSNKNEIVTFRLRDSASGIVGDNFDNKLKENPKEKKSQGDVKAQAVTLISILDYLKAPAVIDYFSLDIEGAEFIALQYFDFNKYRFNLMSVERCIESLHDLLLKHGYRYLILMSSDVFYVHIDAPFYKKAMAYSNGLKHSYSWYGVVRHYLRKQPPS